MLAACAGPPVWCSTLVRSPTFAVPAATRPVATRPRKLSCSTIATSMAKGSAVVSAGGGMCLTMVSRRGSTDAFSGVLPASGSTVLAQPCTVHMPHYFLISSDSHSEVEYAAVKYFLSASPRDDTGRSGFPSA